MPCTIEYMSKLICRHALDLWHYYGINVIFIFDVYCMSQIYSMESPIITTNSEGSHVSTIKWGLLTLTPLLRLYGICAYISLLLMFRMLFTEVEVRKIKRPGMRPMY